MIELVLFFFGALVVLPAGFSFVVDGDVKPRKKKEEPIEQPVVEEPVVNPDPVVVAQLKATKKTVVTVTPICSDEGSEGRLRTASLDFLEQVDGLPDETVFEVNDCGEEGLVDIQIIETVEKVNPPKP
tara:strand:+ start:374 stop:757 length:384 start_codon:yes stop_codon:yes gene_type:complete